MVFFQQSAFEMILVISALSAKSSEAQSLSFQHVEENSSTMFQPDDSLSYY